MMKISIKFWLVSYLSDQHQPSQSTQSRMALKPKRWSICLHTNYAETIK